MSSGLFDGALEQHEAVVERIVFVVRFRAARVLPIRLLLLLLDEVLL